MGPVALTLLACAVLPTPARADVTAISWKPYSELTVRSTADDEATAQMECVQWTIGQHLLAPDVLRLWKTEIDQAIAPNVTDCIKSIEPKRDGYYVTLKVQQIAWALITVIFGTITPRVAVCTSGRCCSVRCPTRRCRRRSLPCS